MPGLPAPVWSSSATAAWRPRNTSGTETRRPAGRSIARPSITGRRSPRPSPASRSCSCATAGCSRSTIPSSSTCPSSGRFTTRSATSAQITIRHLMSPQRRASRASTWPWGGDQPWHPFEPTRVGPARGDVAVHRGAVRAGHAIPLLEPRHHLPRPDHRDAVRRGLRDVRHQEHPDAARDARDLLRSGAVSSARPHDRTATARTDAGLEEKRASISTPASRCRTAG